MSNKPCKLNTISQADVIEAMHEYARHHYGLLDEKIYEFVNILTGLDDGMIWDFLLATQERGITL